MPPAAHNLIDIVDFLHLPDQNFILIFHHPVFITAPQKPLICAADAVKQKADHQKKQKLILQYTAPDEEKHTHADHRQDRRPALTSLLLQDKTKQISNAKKWQKGTGSPITECRAGQHRQIQRQTFPLKPQPKQNHQPNSRQALYKINSDHKRIPLL